MPLPRKTYKDTQAYFKACSAYSGTPAANVVDENGKTKTKGSPALSSSKPNIQKDTRAYEHERQRLKKAADLVKRRARKAQQGSGLVGSKSRHRSASVASSTPSEKGRRLQEGDDEFYDIEGLILSDSWKENLGVVPVVAEQPRYEFNLADLVRMGKPRRSKGDGDFEVIPHIRSVIVLDDTAPDEFDVDEPWEHISNPDTEVDKGPSYAQVAALAK